MIVICPNCLKEKRTYAQRFRCCSLTHLSSENAKYPVNKRALYSSKKLDEEKRARSYSSPKPSSSISHTSKISSVSKKKEAEEEGLTLLFPSSSDNSQKPPVKDTSNEGLPKNTGKDKQDAVNLGEEVASSSFNSPNSSIEAQQEPKNLDDDIEDKEPNPEDFKHQCGVCGAYFNQFKNKTFCPNCNEDWADYIEVEEEEKKE